MPFTTFSSYTAERSPVLVLVAVKREIHAVLVEQVLDGEPQRVPDAVSGVLSALEERGVFVERAHISRPQPRRNSETPFLLDSCSQGHMPPFHFFFFFPTVPRRNFRPPPEPPMVTASSSSSSGYVAHFLSPAANSSASSTLYSGQYMGLCPWTGPTAHTC